LSFSTKGGDALATQGSKHHQKFIPQLPNQNPHSRRCIMSAIRLLLSCILVLALIPVLAFSEPENEVVSMRTRTAKTLTIL
jgi:hypothetical protein